jgi:malonyl-CoA O-methyltransferase
MAILSVIPSDPISAYEAKGTHVWAERYYNPGKYFETVYLLSPLEKREVTQYGMQTIPTQPKELKKRLRELPVDLIRAYGGYWACDMACKNKVAGVPVVVSVHDTNPQELYDSIRHADYVFCMSRAVRDLVLTKFPDPARVWILPNRYDASMMYPIAGGDFSDLDPQCPHRYKLLCVGRLSEQKNQDNLVRALKHLGPDYGCLFIGRNDPDQLQALAAELGVTEQCHFLPSVRNDELVRYYHWADAMVTPSRWEGFGIVFIEALACGAVVVTSNVGPMNEYIRHEENGLLVDRYEDPQALAETVVRACTDSALRARLRAAGPGSVAQFERAHVDAIEVAYYRRILAEKPIYREGSQYPERCVRRAVRWLERHSAPGKGVWHSSRTVYACPGISGYLIPTLLGLGEQKLARQYATWLVAVQNEDGSWNGPSVSGKPSAFYTGQILKGLLAIHSIMPEVQEALLNGCDWLAAQVTPEGRVSKESLYKSLYLPGEKVVPEAFHLHALTSLEVAGRRFGRAAYGEAVRRALDCYRQDPNLGAFETQAHFHAYIVEALLELGERERALTIMRQIESLQREDGSVPAWPDCDWVCSSGLAQYALIWLKLGQEQPARRAFAWLCAHQTRSGGFLGSYGDQADYLPTAEISWAVKYFLDVFLYLVDQEDPQGGQIPKPGWNLLSVLFGR